MPTPWPVSGVCRYPDQCLEYAGTLTSVWSMQVPWPVSGVCRYPDGCQGHAGTLTGVWGMQVPWPVSRVCKNPDRCLEYAGTLTGVWSMQVPWPVSGVCRYPGGCQGYAGTLTGVWSMQVPWLVSGVCRYPDRCLEYAGTLTGLWSMQVPWPVSGVCRYPDRCQGYAETGQLNFCLIERCVLRGFSACCHAPHIEGYSIWKGLLYSTLRSESDNGETQNRTRTGNRTRGPGFQAQSETTKPTLYPPGGVASPMCQNFTRCWVLFISSTEQLTKWKCHIPGPSLWHGTGQTCGVSCSLMASMSIPEVAEMGVESLTAGVDWASSVTVKANSQIHSFI